eukprot:COSAG01_NODE_14280_length_1467_cov_1.800582_2_plen_206_part_00
MVRVLLLVVRVLLKLSGLPLLLKLSGLLLLLKLSGLPLLLKLSGLLLCCHDCISTWRCQAGCGSDRSRGLNLHLRESAQPSSCVQHVLISRRRCSAKKFTQERRRTTPERCRGGIGGGGGCVAGNCRTLAADASFSGSYLCARYHHSVNDVQDSQTCNDHGKLHWRQRVDHSCKACASLAVLVSKNSWQPSPGALSGRNIAQIRR